jgi:arylsulfatase
MKRVPAALLAALALSLASSARAGAPAAPARRPHVLVVLADDLGFSDLGSYGGEINTPRLDGLAKNGVRFSQFYNTARCWPSRAALLTGYYAQQVRRDAIPGAGGGEKGVRPRWARLLPDFLKPLGYRSYHSGKWHVDGSPLAGGFDRSYRLEDHSRFFGPLAHFEDDRKLPPAAPGSGYYATVAIADHAIRFLEEHRRQHAPRPFFLYLAFTAPHFPLHALPADIERYRARYQAGWDRVRGERWRRVQALGLARGALGPFERDLGPPYDFPDALARIGPGEVNRPLAWTGLTGPQRELQATKMAIHAAMVDRMDREIGRVLDQIRAMGAFEDTLVVFASDNGASAEIMVRGDGHDPEAAPGSAATHLCLGPGWSTVANTPLRRHKTWVHEGGIATPFIVHWPRGLRARGAVRHTPGHFIDVVPTVLELAGAAKPATWDGVALPAAPGASLVPALAGDGAVSRGDLWWLHEGNRAVRVGDLKLVASRDGAWELYDLRRDRAESNDLAARQPAKVRELERLWNRRLDEARALAAQAPGE